MFSASSLVTACLTGFGAPSTRSLASFETQSGYSAHLFDDLNLLVTHRGKNHVELGLLFFDGGGAPTVAGGGSDSHGSCGSHAKLLFESLDHIGQFEHGHLLDLFDKLLCIHDIWLTSSSVR